MLKKLTTAQEREIAKGWYESDLYSFDKKNNDSKKFYIDTPPPTVSGFLHMGHVFSYVQTDIIARYKRMQGYNVFYPIGFDDNGLPTERLVEKTFEIKVGFKYKQVSIDLLSKASSGFKDVEDLLLQIKEGDVCTEPQFITICKMVVEGAEADFENLFKTIALSVDWGLKYQTISDSTTKISQESFIDLYNKGLIYKKHAPVYWDTTDQTALSQADLEDKEQDSNENIIKFTTENGEILQIMTTRPEMLLACLCVFYHPDDVRYKHLHGKTAKVPFAGHFVPLLADDEVKMDKGTGLVMCCSYGDWQDVTWVRKHNLQAKVIISDDGKIEAEKVEQARKNTIEALKASGELLEQKSIKHPVKCGERSGKPVEILQKEQWYLSILPFKEKLLKAAEKLNFYPDFMKLRLLQWINGLNQDWCISRDRFFGVRLPVWNLLQIHNGEEKLTDITYIGTQQYVMQNTGKIIAGLKDKYDESLYKLKQTEGVLDTWFTSSITPAIAFGNLQNCPVFNIRPQAHEIIRTWAFYTLAKSYLHSLKLVEDKFVESEINIPWSDLMISGWCLAADKTKMSKSKGNVVTPLELIEKNGVDVVRFWCSNSSLGADTAYSEALLEKGGKFTIKLTNVANFVMQKLETIKGFKEVASFNKKSILAGINQAADRWIVSHVFAVFEEYKKNLDKYEYFKARTIVDDFFWNELCDNYLELIKIRYYGVDALIYKEAELSAEQKSKIEAEQKSCLLALFVVICCILQLYAPYCPYICEYIWEALGVNAGKIHQIHSFAEGFFTNKIEFNENEAIDAVLQIIFDVRRHKSDAKLALNAKLETFAISPSSLQLLQKNPVLFCDLKNVTTVETFS